METLQYLLFGGGEQANQENAEVSSLNNISMKIVLFDYYYQLYHMFN